MKCSIKVNLKYISPTTRKLLGASNLYFKVESKEELQKKLVDILIMSEREKEALINKFNQAEEEFLGKNTDGSGSFKQQTLKFTIDDTKNTNNNSSDEIRQIRLEILEKEVVEGKFNTKVKELSTNFAKTLIDKVTKYVKDGQFNQKSFPKLSESPTAVKRLEAQVIPYLKNVLYELSILKNANLDNKKEIEKSIEEIKKYFNNQKQILFFPKYVSQFDKDTSQIYWITDNPNDFGIPDFNKDNDNGFDLTESSFDTFINDKLIQSALEQLPDIENLTDDERSLSFVGIAVKNKNNSHNLYKLRKANNEAGYSVEGVEKTINVSNEYLFIPDIDYKVNKSRDFSKQWDNFATINNLISPRINKAGDNLYNADLTDALVRVSEDVSNFSNLLISKTLKDVAIDAEKFANNSLSGAFEHSIFAKPVFLKGRKEVLVEGTKSWIFDSGDWKLVKVEPTSVITKGLTENFALPVFSDMDHLGNIDTLNYNRLSYENGIIKVETVDLTNLTKKDFPDLSQEEYDKFTNNDGKLNTFIMDNFSVDYDYITKNFDKINLNLNILDNQPVNISLSHLEKYAQYIYTFDKSLSNDILNNIIKPIVDNYKLKVQVLNKAKELKETNQTITLSQLGISLKPNVKAKHSTGYQEFISNYDISELLDESKNQKFVIIDSNGTKAVVFKTVFRENKVNTVYYVMTNVTTGGENPVSQVNQIVSVKDIEDYTGDTDPIYNYLKALNTFEKGLPSNQKDYDTTNRPKVIVKEQSAYVEVPLVHKKIEGDENNEAVLKERQELVNDQFSDILTTYATIASKVYRLLNTDSGFKISDKKNKQLFDKINTLVNDNRFSGLLNSKFSLKDGLKLAMTQSEFKSLSPAERKKVKELEKEKYPRLLNLVEELSIILYNHSLSDKNFSFITDYDSVNIDSKDFKDKFIQSLISGERLEDLFPKLNKNADFELFNINYSFGRDLNSENSGYIPINSTSRYGIGKKPFGLYGFKYWNEDKNLDEMYAFHYTYNDANEFDIKASFVSGFIQRLEYVLFVDGSESILFSDNNSDLAIAVRKLVEIYNEGNVSQSNIATNESGVDEYEKQLQIVKDIYEKKVIPKSEINFSISHNTKKSDWEYKNQTFTAKNKLETNVNMDYPIYKEMKYIPINEFNDIPELVEISESNTPIETINSIVEDTPIIIDESIFENKVAILKDVISRYGEDTNSITNAINDYIHKWFSNDEEAWDFNDLLGNYDADIHSYLFPIYDDDDFNDSFTPKAKLTNERLENDRDISDSEMEDFRQKNLPQFTVVEWESIKDLLKRKNLTDSALGVMSGHLLALREKRAGIFYHEAMHFVIDNLFTKEEQNFYLNEIESKFVFNDNDIWNIASPRGITNYEEAKREFLMEKLADEFALYQLNKPSTLMGRLGAWLKDLFQKILSWVDLNDKLIDVFKRIDSGEFSQRKSNNSKFTRYMLFRNQKNGIVRESQMQGSQKYLFYTILHKKFDYSGSREEKIKSLSKDLLELLKIKVDYDLPIDFVQLRDVLLKEKDGELSIDEDKLNSYYIPFLESSFNLFEEIDEVEEEDKDGKNDEKEKPYSASAYNQDPSKIGGDLKAFISQVYAVKNDNILPEYIYLDTENFVKKLQKIFSTVPIDPSQKVMSFWENLVELSEYDNELKLFKNLIDKVYRENGKFKGDIALMNKLVIKIALEQQFFSKGLVTKKKIGSGVFDEFEVVDAFYDTNKEEIKNLMGVGNTRALNQSEFIFIRYSKVHKTRPDQHELVRRINGKYYRLGDSLETTTEEIPDKVMIGSSLVNNFKLVKRTIGKDPAIKYIEDQFNKLTGTPKNIEFQKAALISYMHSLQGINVSLIYAHLFRKTYEDKMDTIFQDFKGKLTEDSLYMQNAVRYGTLLKIQSVKNGDQSVYALSKANALSIFKQAYDQRLKEKQYIPLNKISISLNHKENNLTDFVELNLAQHIQFSIGQFKRKMLNLDQLEGNKTNFFIEAESTDYSGKNDHLFYEGVLDQYRKNVNQIIANYNTILNNLDSDGLISQNDLDELQKTEFDSVVGFKWISVGDKLKPTFLGKGVAKGYRIYYQHGLDINSKVEQIALNDYGLTNSADIIKERIKDLNKELVGLNIGNLTNKANIDKLISDTVNEISKVLQINLLKTNATTKAKAIDYTAPKYKEFLTNYVRTYLVETDKIYSKVFGDKYFEAFDNATSDFTKRLKSLAAAGDPIHANKSKMEDDIIFHTIEKPKINLLLSEEEYNSKKDEFTKYTITPNTINGITTYNITYDPVTEPGGYFVVTDEVFQANKNEYKKLGYITNEIEATDGQAYNTFLHKYFIQLDKGRSYDLTRAYFTYLMTNGRMIWKEQVQPDGSKKQVLEKILTNNFIPETKSYEYSADYIEEVTKALKFDRNQLSQNSIEKAYKLAANYGITNSEDFESFINELKDDIQTTRDTISVRNQILKDTYQKLKDDGTIDTQATINGIYDQLKDSFYNRDVLLHQLWVDENGKKRNKQQILSLNTELSNLYKDTLEDIKYLHSQIDELRGDENGNSFLIGELNKWKERKGLAIERLSELKDQKQDLKILGKLFQYLTRQQEVEEIKTNPDYEKTKAFVEQQQYIAKVEKDAIKNKYKNGIFKGVTIFKSNERAIYIKNSEATLERSLYMRPDLTKSTKVRGKVVSAVDAIDKIWENIAKKMYDLESLIYSDTSAKKEFVNADGILANTATMTKEVMRNQLKVLFTELYNLHEPIPGQSDLFNKYKYLETTDIDVMAFKSGTKINKIDGIIEVPFGGTMDQSEMPNDKGKVTYGTQLEKILLNDLDPSVTVNISGKAYTAGEVKDLYLKATEHIVNFNIAEVESQLYPNGKIDVKVFSQLLKQFVSTTRSAAYYETFFDIIPNGDTFEFVGIPDVASIANIFYQTLQKVINEPAKFKMNGEAYQLVSTSAYMAVRDENGKVIPLEFRKNGSEINSNPLQPIIENRQVEIGVDENGNILFSNSPREVHETVVPASEPWMREYLVDRRRVFHGDMTQEELDTKYPSELFYMMGNRIPTENKRSIAILKIVDFFIPETGSTIITSAAVQSHTGGDHDGDKFFCVRYNVVKVDGKWQVANRSTETTDKALSKHLLTKSIFSNIISENKSKANAVESFKTALSKVNIGVSKEVLENEFLDYAMGLQSNTYTLSSGLQHEPTDITSKIFKAKVDQQKEFDKSSFIYKATGSPLKIDNGIVEAAKGKMGVGISANTVVLLQAAERLGTMLSKTYRFGGKFSENFAFKLVGSIYNDKLIQEIEDFDKEFCTEFNKWIDENFPNSKNRAKAQSLALMSMRNAILITINTDTVKNEFGFGINLNDITLALYQIGATLNIPTNLLLHIGTHPTVREFTKNPTKEALQDIEEKLKELSEDLKFTKFNRYNLSGDKDTKDILSHQFEPTTLDFELKELFLYGKGFEQGFTNDDSNLNEVVIYYPEAEQRYKYLVNNTAKKLSIPKFSEETLLDIIDIATKPENKDKTYFLNDIPAGKGSLENIRKVLRDYKKTYNEELPSNLILGSKYTGKADVKKEEQMFADYKLLKFITTIYKYAQDLRGIQPMTNINKGDTTIANFFNMVNLLKQGTSNIKKDDRKEINKLLKTTGSKLNFKYKIKEVVNSKSKEQIEDNSYIEVQDALKSLNTENLLKIIDKFKDNIPTKDFKKVENFVLDKLSDYETSLNTIRQTENGFEWSYESEDENWDSERATEDFAKQDVADTFTMDILLRLNSFKPKSTDKSIIVGGLKIEVNNDTFRENSYGSTVGITPQEINNISTPNDKNLKFSYLNLSGFGLDKSYIKLFSLMNKLLKGSALVSEEGMQIIRDLNTAYFDDDAVKQVSFLKYGSLMKGFYHFDRILAEFDRFSNINYLGSDNNGVPMIKNTSDLSKSSDTHNNVNQRSLARHTEFILDLLSERYKDNLFVKNLSIKTDSKSKNAKLLGIPTINNQGHSLDFIKEPIINGLKDIINDTELVSFDVVDADQEKIHHLNNNLVKVEKGEDIKISYEVKRKTLDITYGQLVMMLLNLDTYTRTGEWSNESLVAFMSNAETRDFTLKVRQYQKFKDNLKNKSEKEYLAQTIVKFNSKLVESKLWSTKTAYLDKFSVEKSKDVVVSLDLDKIEGKEDDDRTVVSVQSFYDYDQGNYVKVGNATYKRFDVTVNEKKEVKEDGQVIGTKIEPSSSSVYVHLPNISKDDDFRYLTTTERHTRNFSDYITVDLKTKDANPVQIHNACIIATPNSIIEIIPEGSVNRTGLRNNSKAAIIQGYDSDDNPVYSYYEIGRSNLFKVNLDEIKQTYVGFKQKETIELSTLNNVLGELQANDLIFDDGNFFYFDLKDLSEDLSPELLKIIESLPNNDDTSEGSYDKKFDEIDLQAVIIEYNEPIEKENNEALKNSLVSSAFKSLLPHIKEFTGKYNIMVYDKVYSKQENSLNNVVFKSDGLTVTKVDFEPNFTTMDNFTTLLFNKDLEYLEDVIKYKNVLNIIEGKDDAKFMEGVFENLFETKYGLESKPEIVKNNDTQANTDNKFKDIQAEDGMKLLPSDNIETPSDSTVAMNDDLNCIPF